MIPELGPFALIRAGVVAGVLGTLPLVGAHQNRHPVTEWTMAAIIESSPMRNRSSSLC